MFLLVMMLAVPGLVLESKGRHEIFQKKGQKRGGKKKVKKEQKREKYVKIWAKMYKI